MFEENKNNIEDLDFGFRSVLGQAQETVPAHVWDGVEAGLDRISQRRAAVLWFRRAAVGVAAAAAVTLGVFFGRGTDAELVAPASDSSMIAVADVQKVETVQEETASISATRNLLYHPLLGLYTTSFTSRSAAFCARSLICSPS